MNRSFWLVPAVFYIFGQGFTAAEDLDRSQNPELEILLRFFDATNGLRWTDHTNWLQNEDPCSWHGISCYDGSDGIQRLGNIEAIDLSDNHLVGTLPKEIFQLPYLKSLILRDNVDLHIQFDNIESAKELRYLIISNTHVQSLDNLDQAKRLTQLHITNLQLKGPIPSQIFNLTNLKGLYVNFNSLTGTISSNIGELTDLRELYFYENNLNGQVPPQIGMLTELRVVAMAQNSFTGTLPTELNLLTNLEILSLQRLEEKSEDPGISGPLPSLDQLSQLTELYLEYQMINGTIPESFIKNAPKDETVKIDLSGNKLTGSIPSGLTEFSRLSLFLADNMIDRVSEEFCDRIRGWMGGKVNPLGCEAFLCNPGTFTATGRKSETDECKPCTDAKYAGATECAVSGDVDERAVLIKLYNACGGRFWKDNHNWLDPSAVDVCSWHGIICVDDKINAIILDNNDLTNTPPADIFTLPQLREIDFNSNNIDFKFKGIKAATNLEKLDLTHTDLKSLEGIEELAETAIARLKLTSNALAGNLPAALFQLSTLTTVSLSHNKFSGPIPTEIGKLTSLVKFECYGNILTSQIPTEFGKLVALTELTIAENAFTGSLPSELNALTLLEILSIHQTSTNSNIGGYLHPYRHLGKLTTLHLNDNQLTGTLPENFLADTTRGYQRIDIQLSNNLLKGTVPSVWGSRFDELWLDLTGNMLTKVDESLCALDNWMDAAVGDYKCAAILCPIGTFNEFGRQTDAVNTCKTCMTGNFMGSKICEGEDAVESEAAILQDFFYSTGGNSWKDTEGWISTPDYCTWSGIICDSARSVTAINLNGNGLSGTPPKSIFTLVNLKSLDLRLNQIDFKFEGIGYAKNLESLYLSDTDLNSIDGIGDAKNLMILHLTDNDLTGSIPEELFELPKLKQLFLNYNRISGRLPQNISKWTDLEELYLLHNRLTGQIPAAIGTLTNLKVLAMTENLFTGSLPEELNDLSSIEIIAIQREEGTNSSSSSQYTDGNEIENSRQGSGLRGSLPSFNKLKHLKQLYLGVNSLTGTIPYDFLDGIEDKTQQIDVDLISNRLSGRVPASLTQFGKLSIYLAGNKAIDGIASGICLQNAWMTGDVEKYGCDGILCPPDTFSRYGRQHDNDSVCKSCEQGTSARSYGNFACFGETDRVANDEREILAGLFLATDGYNWAVQTNWLDPTKSICEWYGITCASDSTQSVSAILLSRNNLNGTIPSKIFSLEELTEINFSYNNVGIDFNEVNKLDAKKVEFMNLDGLGLSGLSGIDVVSSTLKLLHVGENNFNFSFPSEILSLSNLEALYMSKNDFTGELPSSIGSLPGLVFLSCANCGFKMELPSWLGDLTALQYLSLENNGFTGQIPSELQKLSRLKHLDLSDQISAELSSTGLTGPLPDFAEMTSLTELYLYRNSFSGPIPPSFLRSNNSTDQITVDLRINLLSGDIPTDLVHISDLNIYLADNKIDSIPQLVCQAKWNDGEGSDCEFILCKIGTFNSLGRKTNGSNCLSCDSNMFWGQTQCNPNPDRKILEEMFIALNGQDWLSSEGWDDESNTDICTWFGVSCNKESRIQSINLDDNNMVGTLTSNIFNLEMLEILDLSKNAISLNFTGIENATSLVGINLSETAVTSLAGIGNARSLTSLRMTANRIPGKIPNELFELLKLERLYLNYNELTGSFPTEVGLLTELKEFYLFHNALNGTLPSEIGALSNVTFLGLGENIFSGPLPTQMTSLTNLQVLSLQRQTGSNTNGLHGLIGNILSFEEMVDLRELYLGGNSLTGPIPSEFLSGITDKTATVRVDLTVNKINGSIPESLKNFVDLKLFLAGNEITKIPPELCEKSGWMDGGVGEWSCDALLCPPGYFNEYGRRVSADDPCVLCAFEDNSTQVFFGSIECGRWKNAIDLDDERAILRLVFNELRGKDWTNHDRWEDDRSICEWHGVSCFNSSVTTLKLSNNGLNGTIPPSLFHLPNLKMLDVSMNTVVDFSFEGIGLDPVMETINAQNTGITTLKGIAQLKNLIHLQIENNQFKGQDIPEELFSLAKLTTLHMSNSKFSGKLSTKIGSLSFLTSLYMHKNDISGEIPSEIGLLTRLQQLDLSENKFWGTLPTALSAMTALVSLFLQSSTRNGAGITGPLLNFSKLINLRTLDLGSNTLTGSIPADFLSLDAASSGINIGLKRNRLTGTIPAELGRFQDLDIDVTGNNIGGIASTLCSKQLWNDDAVGKFGCDGILCKPGSYNNEGRQTTKQSPCIPCGDTGAQKYYGATICTSKQKAAERKTLEGLYMDTGGMNWKKSDNWLDNTIDICEWFGVSCRDGETVTLLLLGGNNLVGTIPKTIFDLPNLSALWLYSNPITFSFDSIENARHLVSILLDSTNLKTLEGVGKATALQKLDVRFNDLQGKLTSEFEDLTELTSLSCSNNKLTGTIPSFSTNRKLNTVRLGNNQLTGKLPSFASNFDMITIDLSENLLTGSIPTNFFESSDPSAKITVDLSKNMLTGTVPAVLSRFNDVTLYLRDNQLSDIAQELCQKVNWNNGDVGAFQCTGIMCPPQFYAVGTGRTSKSGATCEACDQAAFYGSSCCGVCVQGTSTASKVPPPLATVIVMVGMIVAAVFY